MTTDLFAADVSYYQVPVDDSYGRRWLIFRGGDGSVDSNAAQNLAWCERALADGRLLGYTIYWVYRPGDIDNILRYADELGAPTDCHMMIDCESWGGQISGNRSGELNKLAKALRKRQGGQPHLIWGYGNQPDLAHLWPKRPKWLRLVVAGYSNHGPALPRMVGWQYTDGEDRWPVPDGWPRMSAPFGRCDHNRLYLTEQDLGDNMLSKDDIDAVADAVLKKLGSPRAWGSSNREIIRNWGSQIRKAANDNSRLLDAVNKRLAQLQADVATLKTQQASVSIEPTDVPVTGTLHVGDPK